MTSIMKIKTRVDLSRICWLRRNTYANALHENQLGPNTAAAPLGAVASEFVFSLKLIFSLPQEPWVGVRGSALLLTPLCYFYEDVLFPLEFLFFLFFFLFAFFKQITALNFVQ